MKVLSDNTAARLLRHLDAAEGGAAPRRIPRGASTTPPALMWQIHVVPSTGVVTVDGGDVYANGTRYTLANSSPGTATGYTLVVWSYDPDGPAGGAISLMSSVSSLTCPFRVLGAINETNSVYTSEQYCSNPIEIGDGDGDGLLPFDLDVIDGDPCIYLPTDPDNLVYVRGEPNQAGRDASATPVQGDGGWVHLSPDEGQSSVGTVWAWATWDHGNSSYTWGVSTTDPLNHTSALNRYIASVEIGKFAYDDEAEEYTVEAQYRHGSLIVADDQGDDLSVERDGYNQTLTLREFQAGNHTGAEWDDVDYLVREERDGEYQHQPYRLNYLAGSTLRAAIADLVSQLVQEAIDDLLKNLIIDLGGSGSGVGDLADALDDRYQPICEEVEPSWGIDHGQWTGTHPQSLMDALSALDSRITALENPNAAQ